MPKPLAPLFDSPRDLLEKARRDLARLEAATGDGDARSDALLDACCAVYHVWDWIAAMRPEHKVAAKKHGQASPSIRMCRDICNAGKHFDLRDAPPLLVREVHHTIPAVSEVAYDDTPSRKLVKLRTRDRRPPRRRRNPQRKSPYPLKWT